MSQVARRIENYTADELRDLMEARGRALFIREIAALADLDHFAFRENLIKVLGDDGIDELDEAQEAIDKGEDPFPQLVQSMEEFALRKECAEAVGEIENIGPQYAAALRGEMDFAPGIRTLVRMLSDQRIKSKWKGQRGDRAPIRLAIDAAICGQAKKAIEKRQRASAEIDRLVNKFKACHKRRDVEGMEDACKKLRDAELQAVLVKRCRGVENRNVMLAAYQKIVDEVFKVKAGV